MVRTKVSGDLISMMSETGATSNFAATLGRRFYGEQQLFRTMVCVENRNFTTNIWEAIKQNKKSDLYDPRQRQREHFVSLTLPNAEAPAQMWVKLNCLCVSRTSGVSSSERRREEEEEEQHQRLQEQHSVFDSDVANRNTCTVCVLRSAAAV